jgi:hypothetical protein
MPRSAVSMVTKELGFEELSALRESPVMDELAEDPGHVFSGSTASTSSDQLSAVRRQGVRPGDALPESDDGETKQGYARHEA